MVEGARLESVFRGNSNVGSNPTLSASIFKINNLHTTDTGADTDLLDSHHASQSDQARAD